MRKRKPGQPAGTDLDWFVIPIQRIRQWGIVILLLLVLFGSDARSEPDERLDKLVVGLYTAIEREQQKLAANRYHLAAGPHHLPFDVPGAVVAVSLARAEQAARVAHPLFP